MEFCAACRPCWPPSPLCAESLLPNRQASRPGQEPTERGRQLQQFATSRGRRLRRALSFNPEASPLAQDRLRNVIEHLDEYIDEWFFDGNALVVDALVTD